MMQTLKHTAIMAAIAATLALPAAALAQTYDQSSTTGATPAAQQTPGAPNTGAGGGATGNMLVLLGSALAVIGGTFYLARKAARQP